MVNHKGHKDGSAGAPLEPVAGNGLLDRRALLGRGVALAGTVGTGVGTSLTSAAAEPLTNGPWSLAPGVPIPPYGQPSKFEQKVVRTLSNPKLEPRGSAARTPHHLLNGTITPNGLHFVIARGGETEVDPDKHRLLIHGLVRQPMVYTLDALHRYPMVSRISFMECGGNSAPLYSKEPIQANVHARAVLLRRVDRRDAQHAARGSRRQLNCEVVHRRRRGPANDESEHSACQSNG